MSAIRKLSSSSRYSTTPYIPSCIERLLATHFDYDFADENQPAYTLNELLGTESGLASWLNMQLNPANFKITSNKEIPSLSHAVMPPLGTMFKKLPDVTIFVSSSKYVQIEIESNGKISETLKKLEIDLIDQLRYQRNMNDTVMSCSGFYFPPSYRKTQVLRVTVTWKDDPMEFWSYLDIIHYDGNHDVDGVRRDVVLAIKEVLEKESEKNLGEDAHKWFAIPLSKSWVQGKFSDSAEQICSSQSILIIDYTKEEVHKFPFDGESASVLKDFLRPEVDQHVCLPKKRSSAEKFFTFKLLSEPISTTGAKKILRDLVKGIVSAVQHLHDHFTMAHLDIRLPNICFDSNGKPVLIDLDRCMHIDESVGKVRYGKSVMYCNPRKKRKDECTVRHLDWLQVGLLICSILDERDDSIKDYHADLPVLDEGTFLYSLVNLGEYVPDQHETWDPNLFSSKFTRQL